MFKFAKTTTNDWRRLVFFVFSDIIYTCMIPFLFNTCGVMLKYFIQNWFWSFNSVEQTRKKAFQLVSWPCYTEICWRKILSGFGNLAFILSVSNDVIIIQNGVGWKVNENGRLTYQVSVHWNLFSIVTKQKVSSLYGSNRGSFQSPKQTLISFSADKPWY